MDVENIRHLGEEEYIVMNLDSRQMNFDGDAWNVADTKGNVGLDEHIPYVTSIELVDSYIPNTFYNVEEYNNVIVFGTELERYVLNKDDHDYGTATYNITQSTGFKEIPTTGNDITIGTDIGTIPARPYVKLYKKGSLGSNGSFFIKQSKIDAISHTYDGATAVIGYRIHLSPNDLNVELRNVTYSSFFVDVRLGDGTIVKQGDVDSANDMEIVVLNGNAAEFAFGEKTSRAASDIVGWFNDPNDPSSPRIVGDIVTDSIDGVDDIPENVTVRVFTKKTFVFPAQNYTVDTLLSATNDALKTHLHEIFKNYESDINTIIQYDAFLVLHLQAEYDVNSRKFTFVSKHGHGFFIDFTHENSANTEFGFAKQMYFSDGSTYKHVHHISNGDETSSFNFTELRDISRGVVDSTASDVYLYQTYNTYYYSTEKTSLLKEFVYNVKNSFQHKVFFVNDYPFSGEVRQNGTIIDTLISYFYVKITNNDPVIIFKKSNYNILVSASSSAAEGGWYGVSQKYVKDFNDKTFIDKIEYSVNAQCVKSDNIVNLSGERYVDLVCPEIQKELKRYNAGYNKLNRYYFDDISDLYVTSSKGNVADLVLRNPREFGPIAKLSKLSFRFVRSDGFTYDFKSIPFFMTISIKYLKPVLNKERREKGSSSKT